MSINILREATDKFFGKQYNVKEEIIISSLIYQSHLSGTVDDVLKWVDAQRKKIACTVEMVPLNHIDGWYLDDGLNLRHKSGKFFSIIGVHLKTDIGIKNEWSQPIINQPEIGILGIICQRKNGVLHFLMQAKIEPGNINIVQLSPTLQATKSNYTQVHQGKSPKFLEYFKRLEKVRVIVDQLQSEQGARFNRKRNRNIIIEIDPDENIAIPEEFCWLTLGQLKALLQFNNVVNMDSRTVLSCILLSGLQTVTHIPSDWYLNNTFLQEVLFSQLDGVGENYLTTDSIISWFTNLKARADFDLTTCNVSNCDEWLVNEYCIEHKQKKYFKVIGTKINIENREVTKWAQPLIQQIESGIVGFLVKKINGKYHLLVQAKMEVGNMDILEMAPTVQCITGSYRNQEYQVPFLEHFISTRDMLVHYDTLQSEEGGRFFHEQNRYMVIEPKGDFNCNKIPDNYIWMSLFQVKEFIKFNNYFNIEARSLIACFSPV
jgi:oxidase EvaA